MYLLSDDACKRTHLSTLHTFDVRAATSIARMDATAQGYQQKCCGYKNSGGFKNCLYSHASSMCYSYQLTVCCTY